MDTRDVKGISPVRTSKKRRLSVGNEETLGEEESDDRSPVSPKETMLALDPLRVKPMCAISTWVEPDTTTKRITVAVILPSGVGKSDFKVRVPEGGMCVELYFTWPNALVDVATMHRKWLRTEVSDRFERYHPKCVGFDEFFKELRSTTLDEIESVAEIPLPFAVESHIDQTHNLGWLDSSARMIYIDLKAAAEKHAILPNDNEFELC